MALKEQKQMEEKMQEELTKIYPSTGEEFHKVHS